MDATTSESTSIQFLSKPEQPIAAALITYSPPATFERRVGQCFGDSAPGEFPLAANPSVVLRIHALAGPGLSVAVTSTGAVYSFGCNSSGQLGHGTAEEGSTPDEPKPRLIRSLQGIRIIQATVGTGRTMLVSDAGKVYAFGNNVFGEMEHGGGQGSKVLHTPQIVESLKEIFVVQVTIGHLFTAVLSREGRVYTFSWGLCIPSGVGWEESLDTVQKQTRIILD